MGCGKCEPNANVYTETSGRTVMNGSRMVKTSVEEFKIATYAVDIEMVTYKH